MKVGEIKRVSSPFPFRLLKIGVEMEMDQPIK